MLNGNELTSSFSCQFHSWGTVSPNINSTPVSCDTSTRLLLAYMLSALPFPSPPLSPAPAVSMPPARCRDVSLSALPARRPSVSLSPSSEESSSFGLGFPRGPLVRGASRPFPAPRGPATRSPDLDFVFGFGEGGGDGEGDLSDLSSADCSDAELESELSLLLSSSSDGSGKWRGLRGILIPFLDQQRRSFDHRKPCP
jgi:hypothetical protein